MESVKPGVYHIKFPLSRRGAMFAYHHSRDEDYIVAIKMPPLRCLLCYDHDAENLGVSGGCYGAHGGFSGLPVKSQSVPDELGGVGGSMSSLSTNASYGGGAHGNSKSSSCKPSGLVSQFSVPKDMHLMRSSKSANNVAALGTSRSRQHTPESLASDHNGQGNSNGNGILRNKSSGHSPSVPTHGSVTPPSRQVSPLSGATSESRARFQIAQATYERELCFHVASAQRPHSNIIRSSTRQLYMSVPAHWEDGEKPAIVMEVAHASLQHWMLFLTHVEDRSSQDFYASRVRKWALHATDDLDASRHSEKGPKLWAGVRLEVAKRVVRCLIEGLRHMHQSLRFSHNKIRAPHVLLLIEERDQGGSPDALGAGMSSRCTGSTTSRRSINSSAAGSLSVKLAGFSGADEFPSLDASSDDMVNAMQASDLGFSCDMELYQQCENGRQMQRPGFAAEMQKIQAKVQGDLSACGKLLHNLNQEHFLSAPDPQLAKIVHLLRGDDELEVPSADVQSSKLEVNEVKHAGTEPVADAGLRSPTSLISWPEGLDEAVEAFLGQNGALQHDLDGQQDGRDDFEREVETKLVEVMEYLKAWVRWRERPDKNEYHQGRPTVKTIKLEERNLFKSIGAFFKGVIGGGKTT